MLRRRRRGSLQLEVEGRSSTRDMEQLRKKNGTLESVIRGMQNQGRQSPATGALEADTESDYDDEYEDEDEEEDEEEGSEEEGEDDDTEEDEYNPATNQHPVPYGPVPPPPSSQGLVNGTKSNGKVNGEVNGIKAGAH